MIDDQYLTLQKDPQFAEVSMQSPQSATTPRRLTLAFSHYLNINYIGKIRMNTTLLFYNIESQKKWPCLVLSFGIVRDSQDPRTKRIFEIPCGILEIIPRFMLRKALGRSLRQILDKVTKSHFQSTSNKIIWPPKKSKSMQGLKSAILAIFQ